MDRDSETAERSVRGIRNAGPLERAGFALIVLFAVLFVIALMLAQSGSDGPAKVVGLVGVACFLVSMPLTVRRKRTGIERRQ